MCIRDSSCILRIFLLYFLLKKNWYRKKSSVEINRKKVVNSLITNRKDMRLLPLESNFCLRMSGTSIIKPVLLILVNLIRVKTKCLHGSTHNANVSLNHLIWNRLPKRICLFRLDTLVSVSYTHLDVYKRQVYGDVMDESSVWVMVSQYCNEGRENVLDEEWTGCSSVVTYDLLYQVDKDVYKRQLLR